MGNGIKDLFIFILEDWKLVVFLSVILALYFYYTSIFGFFQKKGIKYMKPRYFFGNLPLRFLGNTSFHEYELYIYNQFTGERFGGFFEGKKPILYIFDSELIKAITIRDFDYFVDRNMFISREPRYLSRSLLHLKGSEWKAVRSTVTPTFSAARLKNMLPLVDACSQQMVKFLQQFDKKDVEMKDTLGRFTLEIIGTCAFGIQSDALKDENAEFVKLAEKFNYLTWQKRMLLFFVLTFMPGLITYLNTSFYNHKSTNELMKILKNTKTERKVLNIRKKDFLQLLLDAAVKEREQCTNATEKTYLDDDTIDAQCFLFLIAGYETSSTLLSFAIYTLAIKPELQVTLRNHIKDVTKDKEMSYELISQLDFLEAFLLETLRMYPPIARIDRCCTKKYNLPNTNVYLEPGDIVAIPAYAIHMDPKIYPEPNEFKPERFMDKEKKRPSHFLAFGIGPRYCIGLRFAMFTAKYAMVTLLKNFTFSPCSKTEIPIRFEKKEFLLKPMNGIWVKIEKI